MYVMRGAGDVLAGSRALSAKLELRVARSTEDLMEMLHMHPRGKRCVYLHVGRQSEAMREFGLERELSVTWAESGDNVPEWTLSVVKKA